MATIESQVTSILSLVTAQTAAISELAKSVTAANGQTPADNSAVLSAISALDAKVTDVQAQLESPALSPAPAPSPEPAPSPAA